MANGPYDLLLHLLICKLVKFQFQMSTHHGRLGRRRLLPETLPGRFISMHLQDVDMNAPGPLANWRADAGRRPQVAAGRAPSIG